MVDNVFVSRTSPVFLTNGQKINSGDSMDTLVLFGYCVNMNRIKEFDMVNLNNSKVPNSRRVVLATKHGTRDVFRHFGRSLLIILTVAVGVALAIAIIAAANGCDDKVRNLLAIRLLPPQIDLSTIQGTLDQTRDALTYLAYVFSGMFVGIVTWVSMEKRRYAIGAARAKGLKTTDLITEYMVEAIILCVLGGFTGIGLGYVFCQFIPNTFPLLPMHFKWLDVLHVFPQVSGLSFFITFLITIGLALRPDPTPQL